MRLVLKLVSCPDDKPLTVMESAEQTKVVKTNDIIWPRPGNYWISEDCSLSTSLRDPFLVRITWPDAHQLGPLRLVTPARPCGQAKCYIRLRHEATQRPVGKSTHKTANSVDTLFLGDTLGICSANGCTYELLLVDQEFPDRAIFSREWDLRLPDSSSPHHFEQHDLGGNQQYVFFKTPDSADRHLVIMKCKAAHQKNFDSLNAEFKKRMQEMRACLAINPEVTKKGLYPQLLNPGDTVDVCREAYTVEQYDQPLPKKNLHDLVVARKKEYPASVNRQQRSSDFVVEYAELWSILTQVYALMHTLHVSDTRNTGHGALIPSNIWLHEEGKADHHRVIVRGFAYKEPTWPTSSEGGFFPEPKAKESPQKSELDYLNNWRMRDRFALGSLFYFMARGEPPKDCSLDALASWRRERLNFLKEVNSDQPDRWEKIENFLTACWTLNPSEKDDEKKTRDLGPLLDGMRPRPQVASMKPIARRRHQAWIGFTLRSVIFLLLCFVLTVIPWSFGKPLGPWAIQIAHSWTDASATPNVVTQVPLARTPSEATPTDAPTFETTKVPAVTATLSPSLPQSIVIVNRDPTSTSESPTATHTPPVKPPTRTPTPDLQLPLGIGCGEGVSISSPSAWETLRGDKEVIGTADLDGRVAPGELMPWLRHFARYQLWLVGRGADLANVDDVGWLIVDSPQKRHNSELGTLAIAEAKDQGFATGEYGLVLRIVYPTGDAQVPGCVVPIRIVTDAESPSKGQ
jgi:hypothetical protein